MQNPLLTTFHDMRHDAEIETFIQEKFEKVKAENPSVIKCHVILEKQSKHHKKGNMTCVRLDLKISRFDDIVVSEKCLEETVPLKSAIIRVFKQAIDLAREQKKHRAELKRMPVELPPPAGPAEAAELAEAPEE
jgi:hypothetical protein